MKVHVRYMSITGFTEIGKEVRSGPADALEEVKRRYAPAGFKNFKVVDEVDMDGGRITATTPNGRHGRNLAFYDYDYQE